MDNDVSAGSTTTIVGRLALGITLLAFGLGYTDLIDGVTAADAVSIAHYVGGVALFVVGSTHGLVGRIFGSVAGRLAKRAKRPVIVIP